MPERAAAADTYKGLTANLIKAISTAPIAVPTDISVTRIQGGGRTLMPGLIDAHTHIMFETLSQIAILTAPAVATAARPSQR